MTDQDTEQLLKEVSRQIERPGDKFGSYFDDLALPSMSRALEEDFGMQVICPRIRSYLNDRCLEIGVLAYSNTNDDVYVVEVTSELREDFLERMRRILRDFRTFFPVHRDKKIYGILAAVDAPDAIREKVLREGIYLARVHDGHFEVQVPESFQPRAF